MKTFEHWLDIKKLLWNILDNWYCFYVKNSSSSFKHMYIYVHIFLKFIIDEMLYFCFASK